MRVNIALLGLVSFSAANVVPRQDTTDVPIPTGLSISPDCITKLASIASEVPTVPPALASDQLTLTDISAVCHYTPPASLKSDQSTYLKSLSAYLTKNSAIFSSCVPTDNPYYSSLRSIGANICSSTGAASQPTATAGSGGSSASATGGSSASNPAASSTSSSAGSASSSSSSKPNSAVRETGMGMAALAGVIMVAAFL